MTGDGLPDVLRSNSGRMLLWHNRGDGWLEGPLPLAEVPSTVSLARGKSALADLDGNGRVELFAVDQPLQLAFETTGKGDFRPDPIVFRNRPNLRLAAGDTRLTDVDGDGVTDLISTGRSHLLLYRHQPGQGWQEPEAIRRIADLERFPDVTFGERGVRLADMTGDGLQDFVTVRSGDVCYWPHLGNGHYSQRVEMLNSPLFPPGYRDDRVHVLDIDGDGCSDIVYFDHDSTLIWLNQSGVAFAAPVAIPVTPAASGQPLAADFFGDGRPGFAWSCTPTVVDSAGYKFLRIDAGRAPYLMTGVDNGMGGQSTVDYANTTLMRLEDRAAGYDWSSELPFVVHVVAAIHEGETISGRATALRMHYHDGTFDGPERQFRGFTRVTVEMSGDDSVPASVQEVTFFQGDPEHPDVVTRPAASISRNLTYH